jgi:hypothetical protein
MWKPKSLTYLAVVAAALATQPTSSLAAPPTVPLAGGYVVYWGDTAHGCQVVANPDGSYLCYNERNSPPHKINPVPGNPYKFAVEGGAGDLTSVTVLVRANSISLLWSNHTEWVKPN